MDTVLETLSDSAVDLLPEGEGGLAAKLAIAEKEQRPLRVKFGIDPTTADIHIGHCVPLQKLRQFQDAGHLAVLIIGDYTARVGDPSQRSKSRPMASPAQIAENARTYHEQALRILDPERTEVRWNGEWLGTMQPAQLFELMSRSTLARLLERDDFAKRHAAGSPITMLELMYPLLQGYDSVVVEADVELGGTDQLYNLLMGRTIQPHYGQQPQVVLTMPILAGTDGVQKMSKSLGNYIALDDEPFDVFGKVMSIPDEAMPEFWRLATGLPPAVAAEKIARIEEGWHPNEAKRALGRAVVARLHDDEVAAAAEARFDTLFKAKVVPDDAPKVSVNDLPRTEGGAVDVIEVMKTHLGVPSNREARRLVEGGGVRIDGVQLTIEQLELPVEGVAGTVVQVGKRRFLRVEQ